MIQDEYLLSRSVMSELCTEAAKLKVLGAMEMIPTDKLTRLLGILELNIRGGDRISPITDVIFLKQKITKSTAVIYRRTMKVCGSTG